MQEEKSKIDILSELPDRIRLLRHHKKLSQDEFADKIGFGRTKIHDIENGILPKKEKALQRFIDSVNTVFSVDLSKKEPSDFSPPSGTQSANDNEDMLLIKHRERLIKVEQIAKLYKEFVAKENLTEKFNKFYCEKLLDEKNKDGL